MNESLLVHERTQWHWHRYTGNDSDCPRPGRQSARILPSLERATCSVTVTHTQQAYLSSIHWQQCRKQYLAGQPLGHAPQPESTFQPPSAISDWRTGLRHWQRNERGPASVGSSRYTGKHWQAQFKSTTTVAKYVLVGLELPPSS
jgi:hypothetical protein